jgi:MGT family glycosyltransferase
MDVLFSIIPGHGHFFPYLPLARALAGEGHDIRFASSASYAETIADHGFEPLPVGLDYTQGSVAAGSDPSDRDRVVAEKMFVEGPRHVAEGLLEVLSDRRPDVMLVDPYELGGQVAAELLEVPFGAPYFGVRGHSNFAGFWPFDHADRVKKRTERGMRARLLGLRRDYGLDEADLIAGEMPYDRRLTLCMAPPSLEPWPLEWISHTAHPLRPESYAAPSEDTWIADLPRDRPIVAVTFGTLFGNAELETAAATAAVQCGARVVVITRHELEIDDPSVHVVPWVSVPGLMDVCSAVVHHGGWGSTVAGLASAVPAVVVPLGADQELQAARLGSVGAAVPVYEGEDRYDRLREAIEAVLENAAYEANAVRLAGEIEAMPSATEVVPLVEQLAETGGPVLNR